MIPLIHQPGDSRSTAHELSAVVRDIGGAMIDNAVLYKAAFGLLMVTGLWGAWLSDLQAVIGGYVTPI